MPKYNVSNIDVVSEETRLSKPTTLANLLTSLKTEIRKFEDLLETLKGMPIPATPAPTSLSSKDEPSFQEVYDALPAELGFVEERIRTLREEFEKLLL